MPRVVIPRSPRQPDSPDYTRVFKKHLAAQQLQATNQLTNPHDAEISHTPRDDGMHTPRVPESPNAAHAKIEGTLHFRRSLAQMLQTLEQLVNISHEEATATLTHEIYKLREQLDTQQEDTWARLIETPNGAPKSEPIERLSKVSIVVDESKAERSLEASASSVLSSAGTVSTLDHVPTEKSVGPTAFERMLIGRSSGFDKPRRVNTSGFTSEGVERKSMDKTQRLYTPEDVFAEKDSQRSIDLSGEFPTYRTLRSSKTDMTTAECGARRTIQQIVKSASFEMAAGVVILSNTVVMAFDLQYNGLEAGYLFRYHSYDLPAEKVWPGAETAFDYMVYLFTVLFCVELVLRYIAYGLMAVRSGWIWFDTIIVTLGVIELAKLGLTFNPGMLRVMRLLRLLRLLKLFQVFIEFDSLFLLIKSIKASFSALLWSFIMLFTVQLVGGLFLCQFLQDILLNGSISDESKTKVFTYFGTFTRTMTTMFEITFANWVPSCRVLVEEVHESLAMFYILYRCFFCFALLRVITAVFITETNRVLEHDDELTKMKRNREQKILKVKLQRLFDELDINHSGSFDWEELDEFLRRPELSHITGPLGFDKYDLMKLFWLLDRGDGCVDVEEFLSKTAKLRGASKAIDMQTLLKLTHRIDLHVQKMSETPRLTGDMRGEAYLNHVAAMRPSKRWSDGSPPFSSERWTTSGQLERT